MTRRLLLLALLATPAAATPSDFVNDRIQCAEVFKEEAWKPLFPELVAKQTKQGRLQRCQLENADGSVAPVMANVTYDCAVERDDDALAAWTPPKGGTVLELDRIGRRAVQVELTASMVDLHLFDHDTPCYARVRWYGEDRTNLFAFAKAVLDGLSPTSLVHSSKHAVQPPPPPPKKKGR